MTLAAAGRSRRQTAPDRCRLRRRRLRIRPRPTPAISTNDGTVDAADYTIWRDGLGTTYTPADYDVWKSHFGETLDGGGSTGDAVTRVPEPPIFILWFAAATILSAIRSRDS